MLSQYSWWDFIKFVLALAIPYYAYVLWVYYREDIRDWWRNRSQPDSSPQIQEAEAEESLDPLFSVNDYSNSSELPSSTDRLDQDTGVGEEEPEDLLPATDHQGEDRSQQEVELDGPDLGQQPQELFGLPIVMASENLQEMTIGAIRSATERIAAGKDGRMKPAKKGDIPAARIADIINQQRGNPLDDIAFNR